MSTKVKKIRASLGFGKTSDADLLKVLEAVLNGMTNNAAYPNPPVAMVDFKSAIDSFSVLVTDALDGGKKVISAKKKQREAVIKQVTLLGHYVEAACNDDVATFDTSGFTAVTTVRTPVQPLSGAKITWVDRGVQRTSAGSYRENRGGRQLRAALWSDRKRRIAACNMDDAAAGRH